MSARPDLRVHTDPDALYEAAAADIAALIADAVAARGVCHVALAGGRTPRGIYEILAHATDVDWASVVFLFGDERAVPPDDPASNYRMADEALFSRLPIPPVVLRMAGERPLAEAVRAYEAVVRVAEPLDLVLLGMGEDGHVASIFPGTPEPDPEARVVATTSPLPPPGRVSLTLTAIARSRAVLLCVTGGGKAERLAEVWSQRVVGPGRGPGRGPGPGPAALPAARAGGEFGILRWHIDEAAAARLPEDAR